MVRVKRALAWGLVIGLAASGGVQAAEFDFTDQDGGAGRPPNFVVIPGIRIAARREIAPDTTIEVYKLTQLGLAGRPFVIGASGFALGVSLSRDFGDISWSGTIESTPSWDGLFNSFSAAGTEFQTQVSRKFSWHGSPWSISPRLLLAYRFSTDQTKERSKVQVTLPVFYSISRGFDLVFVPRLDQRHVPHWQTTRNDVVANVSVGFRYAIRPNAQISAFVGYENRWSSAPEVRYSRWLIVPQLGLRADF